MAKAQLLSLIQHLGPERAGTLIDFLIAHKDQIAAIVQLLMALFAPPRVKAATAFSEQHFIEACKGAGCATGDAQELLAALPD